jgi:hypothetical protein
LPRELRARRESSIELDRAALIDLPIEADQAGEEEYNQRADALLRLRRISSALGGPAVSGTGARGAGSGSD